MEPFAWSDPSISLFQWPKEWIDMRQAVETEIGAVADTSGNDQPAVASEIDRHQQQDDCPDDGRRRWAVMVHSRILESRRSLWPEESDAAEFIEY